MWVNAIDYRISDSYFVIKILELIRSLKELLTYTSLIKVAEICYVNIDIVYLGKHYLRNPIKYFVVLLKTAYINF